MPVAEQLADTLLVVGKAAAGQHHATARPNLDPLAIQGQFGAHHPFTFAQQAQGRRIGFQAHAQIQGAAQQPRHQGTAIDQVQATAM
ncbi:hypothetical protein D3C78_1263730 [compost metagenome]